MHRYLTSDQLLLAGPGALDALPAELEGRSIRRVAVVYSDRASRAAAGILAHRALAGCRILREFGPVRAHAPMADSERWAAELRDDPPDAIVSIGGGSPSDTAKAISILLAEGGSLRAHCTEFRPPDGQFVPPLPAAKIPVVAVATTLSGAEISPGGGTTDEAGVKHVFWDPKVAARIVVLDPAALADVPAEVLLTSGMNGLAHCAEALYSRVASPFTDALALAGARAFGEGLLALAETSPGTQGPPPGLLDAAILGGMVISNAPVGLHHAICHGLGAAGQIAHGVANGVMLPYTLAFNLEASRAEQEAFAAEVRPALARRGAAHTGSAPQLVFELQQRLGIPTDLRQTGLRHALLPRIAEEVMRSRSLYFNPRRVQAPAEVLEVLEAAWSGRLLQPVAATRPPGGLRARRPGR